MDAVDAVKSLFLLPIEYAFIHWPTAGCLCLHSMDWSMQLKLSNYQTRQQSAIQKLFVSINSFTLAKLM